jgi:two-component system sensor histidine kinase KdpD
VSHELAQASIRGGLSGRRRLYGLVVAVLGPVALTIGLLPVRGGIGLDAVLLCFVLASVAASVVGGVAPAVVASLASFGLANFFFTVPYGTLLVANSEELLDLVVFLAVTVLVGVITEAGARVRERTERDRLRAELVAELGNLEGGPRSIENVLEETRNLYGMNAASLKRDGTVLVTTGTPEPGDERLTADAGDGLELELSGPERIGHDKELLASLAATTGRLWRTERLAEQARRAEELTRIDELRSSLLAAVGHDLRNPIAAIRAAAATLGETDLDLEPEERTELLATIDEHAERLNAIIANLLDLSRLQAGALSVRRTPTSLLEVLAGILRYGAGRVELDVPDDLPLVLVDAGLLERVLANLVDNADRHLPSGEKVRIAATKVDRSVAVQVIDHGPGIAPERLAEVFRPFQKFGDRSTTGVGLGLAIARGFTEAMGGTIVPSATPGGGLTMTVTVEVADASRLDR